MKKIKTLLAVILCVTLLVNLSGCKDKEPKEFKDVSLEAQEVLWDGNEHSLEIKGEVPEKTKITYENNNKTDVGTYEVVCKLNKKGYNEKVLTSNLIIKAPEFPNQIVISDGSVQHEVKVETALPEGVSVTYEGNKQSSIGTHKVKAHLVGNNEKTLDLSCELTILLEQPVAIIHSLEGEAHEVLLEAIKEFETKYYGYKIHETFVAKEDLEDTVINGFSEGNWVGGYRPNIFIGYTDEITRYINYDYFKEYEQIFDENFKINLPVYNKNGELKPNLDSEDTAGYTKQDMYSFFNFPFADITKGDYNSNINKEDAKDKIAFPFLNDVDVMYYNPKLLKEIGYDKAPANWNEVWNMAQKFKDKHNDLYPVAIKNFGDVFANEAISQNFMENESAFNKTNKKALDYLNDIKTRIDAGLIWDNYENNDFLSAYNEDKVLFVIDRASNYKEYSHGLVASHPSNNVSYVGQKIYFVDELDDKIHYQSEDTQLHADLLFSKLLLTKKYQEKFAMATGMLPTAEGAINSLPDDLACLKAYDDDKVVAVKYLYKTFPAMSFRKMLEINLYKLKSGSFTVERYLEFACTYAGIDKDK